MTLKELEKQCFVNKKVVVEEKEKKIKEWFKALYKDCEEDIKEDRETGPYVYPSDYTAFDLFIDNIILYAKESDFKDNDFIKLFKELNEVEFTDYKEFAYWAVLNKIINNCYRYGTKLFLPIIIKYKHFMEVI